MQGYKHKQEGVNVMAIKTFMGNYNATMQSKDKADRIAGKAVEVKNEGKGR